MSHIRSHIMVCTGTGCTSSDSPKLISAFEEDLVLFVPSFHPLAARASRDLDCLTSIDIRLFQDTPFVLGGDGSNIYQLAKTIFKQMDMNPTVVFRSDNNLIIKNMVEGGAGVGLLAHSFIEPSDRMVYFSLRPNYYMHITVMVAKNKVLTEEERYLIALFHATDFHNPHYRFNPTPLSRQILEEFHFSRQTIDFI